MSDAREHTTTPLLLQLLPEGLLRLPIVDLAVAETVLAATAELGVTTVGELITLPPESCDWLDGAAVESIRTAIARAIERSLPRQTSIRFDPSDWPALQGHLLIPLDDEQRALVRAVTGIDEPAIPLVDYARRTGTDTRSTEALAERTRARLHERSRQLIARLREETQREMQAADGLLDPDRIAADTMLATMARSNDDQGFPLRLAAFCFPHEYHLRGGMLVPMSPRGLRRLVDHLRRSLPVDRLPVALDELVAELESDRKAVPRGLLTHLLRSELRLSVLIEEHGEVIVPDPRSPSSRLAELLEEEGKPMQLTDLLFAYRERYRRATPRRLEQCLRRDPTFVVVGNATFALRHWYFYQFEAATDLADRAARHVCTEGGKQNVLLWLVQQGSDEQMAWLVLDCLRRDERVRLLGRGDACPATQRRSQVMVQLLQDFRRACGDVVESMFVANQPESRRRLVQRLLAENRMFLRPDEDRVDTLTNYPFNDARLRRLRKVTRKSLEEHGGYAPIEVLVKAVNGTDLGGSWLTPRLLQEVLRRQGWFDVLPGGLVAMRDRALGMRLLRLARHELRSAGVLLTVDEIVRQRPELAEFTDTLGDLLGRDPLVQTPDGKRFSLV